MNAERMCAATETGTLALKLPCPFQPFLCCSGVVCQTGALTPSGELRLSDRPWVAVALLDSLVLKLRSVSPLLSGHQRSRES